MSRRPPRAFVGISGWNYAPWRGVFYPPALRHADELAFACRHFDAIEINGSFYSLQRPSCYEGWYDAAPADFRFAVKGSRYITHMLKLRNVDAALANFFASGVLALGEKLGPILWQLPPQLPFDRERLSAFLERLPTSTDEAARIAKRHDARVTGRCLLRARESLPIWHALEVRHESYRTPSFVKLLRRHGVACCVADTAGVHPLVEDVTADFVYVRLHGGETLYVSGYDRAAIQHWRDRVRAWMAGDEPADSSRAAPLLPPRHRKGRDVYVFFDNDVKVRAPFDAMALREALGRSLNLQREKPRKAANA